MVWRNVLDFFHADTTIILLHGNEDYMLIFISLHIAINICKTRISNQIILFDVWSSKWWCKSKAWQHQQTKQNVQFVYNMIVQFKESLNSDWVSDSMMMSMALDYQYLVWNLSCPQTLYIYMTTHCKYSLMRYQYV